MEYLLEALLKIAVEEIVRIAVDRPGVFQTVTAIARRIAMFLWL